MWRGEGEGEGRVGRKEGREERRNKDICPAPFYLDPLPLFTSFFSFLFFFPFLSFFSFFCLRVWWLGVTRNRERSGGVEGGKEG